MRRSQSTSTLKLYQNNDLSWQLSPQHGFFCFLFLENWYWSMQKAWATH